jgi:hypothetical protein
MGNLLSFPPYQPYEDIHNKKRMEHIAKLYSKKVKADWNKTLVWEASSDDDIIPLLQFAPINELEVLILYTEQHENRLNQESFSVQGISNITLLLEHNTTLKVFGLFHNQMDEEKMRILLETLCNMPNMERIVLCDNQMNSDLVEKVIERVKGMSSLRELNVVGNLWFDGPDKVEQLDKEGYTFELRW